MSVTAVAFDIDGTLYPNRSMYIHSIPFFLSHIRLVRAFNRVRRRIRRLDSIDDFSRVQADLLAREIRVSPARAEELVQTVFYSRWEDTFRRVKPFPGVGELLVGLRERGIKTAALSDFPVGRKLEYFRLDGLWDVVMASHESGRLKPAKEPFLELARRLDTEPSRILYVGNNPRYDVLGSRAAGMKSALVAPAWKKRNPAADIQFSRYAQLASEIDKILSQEGGR